MIIIHNKIQNKSNIPFCHCSFFLFSFKGKMWLFERKKYLRYRIMHTDFDENRKELTNI